MKNLTVFLMPHPPIVLPEIGEGREREAQDTVDAMDRLGRIAAEGRPKTILCISPHGNCFSNGTCLLDAPVLAGSFAMFGHPEVSMEKRVDRELAAKIDEALEADGHTSILMDEKMAESYGASMALDHGAMVPLYFIERYWKEYRIVHLAPGFTSLLESYQIGKCMARVLGPDTLVLCSGDLSHALKSDGPYSYDPMGPLFDEKVQKAIREKDPMELLLLEEKFVEHAAQCGLRSVLMGFGCMDGYGYASRIHSYEGPFGVGYLTAVLEREEGPGVESLVDSYRKLQHKNKVIRAAREDDLVRLARKTIEHHVRTGKILSHAQMEAVVSEETLRSKGRLRAGTFVSLHKQGKLRGCIGTIQPTKDSLLEEIVHNAISACSQDPRFEPVAVEELDLLSIHVDILGEAEEIPSAEWLDPKRYGVIVEKGFKRGLLLPDLDGVDTVEQQVSIALQKAGIHGEEGVRYYRFQVERHGLEED
ncbi:AmmeMemoRadiSam system protein A [Anaerotalea alkaliphila]|uniref:AmmeMemoRadiSam system protein A n=1 Tax=Anaerotalea alkaliphila TaxID=2662126 RepID=A0A7X5HVH4_9FIRM|nr:AmmeMemoRadiSam system protein A [Anaerotalea alkaliphila]NDL67401.1 AmmeMemoRadiSam system protein A [Anaerotalea alkaliphila]